MNRLQKTLFAGACVLVGFLSSGVIADQGQDTDWHETVLDTVKRSVADVEEFADVRWRSFARDMGFLEPRHIAAYSGYGNRSHVWVRGRLLANRPYGGPQEDDRWWDNLGATYQRWDTDEISGAPMVVTYGDSRLETRTDDEGYFQIRFERQSGDPRHDVAIARHTFEGRSLTATHRMFIPSREAEFMVISDMDDTVIHTGITNMLVAARLTFLNNAKTRKPLAGAGGLYRSFVRDTDGEGENPVFYVSNSAWNMWDLLRDFIDLNELPPGPLLLRDIGLGSDSSDHKITSIRALFERFHWLPAVLIGDSGQHDADIYAEIAQQYPQRVLAIYIRDVDPGEDSEYDVNVDLVIERLRDLGIPFLRVEDSAAIAEHAAGIGLVPDSAVDTVRSEVIRDEARQKLAAASDVVGAP